MTDKLFSYIFGLNALINIILILQYDKKNKPKNETQAYSRNFWQTYLLFVPFFVTISIVKELDKKNRIKKDRLNMDNEKMINAWKQAAGDLHIRIETPFIIKSDNEEFSYPILICDFGSKVGTIVNLIEDKIDLGVIKNYGYYCSSINSRSYSKYNRDLFIDTLNDWGFFGDDSNKPDWYTGVS